MTDAQAHDLLAMVETINRSLERQAKALEDIAKACKAGLVVEQKEH